MNGEFEGKETDFEEQAIKDRAEIEILEQRQETREGAEARTKLAEIQTKEQVRLQQIGDKYLSGVSYERDRVIGEIRAYMEQTVRGIIEAGKRLIAMKEAEKHGDWIPLLKDRLGISQASAWRLMAVARKFEKSFKVNDLQIRSGGVSKLYALLSVPDEELSELDETGIFRGATVEAMNNMTLPQFRKLIAEKEDWKAKAEQLELEFSTRRDTTDRLKKANEKLKKEKAELEIRLAEAGKGLPEDSARALEILANHREIAFSSYYFLNNADPEGYADMVRADLLNTTFFLRDIYTLLAHSISNRCDIEQPYPANLLEGEEKGFNEKYASYIGSDQQQS